MYCKTKKHEGIFILAIMIIGSSDHQNFFSCFFALPVPCMRKDYVANFKKLLRDCDSVLMYVCICCCWWLL